MSLNWNVENVKDHEKVTTVFNEKGEKLWNPVTEAIVYYALGCGIPELTEKNVDEFFRRMTLVDTVYGTAMLKGEDGPCYVTREDLVAHIGLSTNASPKTKAQFEKHLIRILEDETRGQLRKRYPKVD